MLFANFEELTIQKEFHFTTTGAALVVNSEHPLTEARNFAHDLFQTIIHKDPLAVHYEIDLYNETKDEEAFLTLVNVILAEFFAAMCTDEGWTREYRLDVPPMMKNLKASLSLLKKAVNHKTVNPMFNLTIHYGDLVYILCDEKEILKPADFLHSVEELEGKANA